MFNFKRGKRLSRIKKARRWRDTCLAIDNIGLLKANIQRSPFVVFVYEYGSKYASNWQVELNSGWTYNGGIDFCARASVNGGRNLTDEDHLNEGYTAVKRTYSRIVG
jgi:hypothetical protein